MSKVDYDRATTSGFVPKLEKKIIASVSGNTITFTTPIANTYHVQIQSIGGVNITKPTTPGMVRRNLSFSLAKLLSSIGCTHHSQCHLQFLQSKFKSHSRTLGLHIEYNCHSSGHHYRQPGTYNNWTIE
jgi:hypothetical protein